LWAFGERGYGWSNSAGAYYMVTDVRAYYLVFDSVGTYPSGGAGNRSAGLPVRCLDILVTERLT